MKISFLSRWRRNEHLKIVVGGEMKGIFKMRGGETVAAKWLRRNERFPEYSYI